MNALKKLKKRKKECLDQNQRDFTTEPVKQSNDWIKDWNSFLHSDGNKAIVKNRFKRTQLKTNNNNFNDTNKTNSNLRPSHLDGWEEKTFKFVNALLKKPKISKSFLRSLTDKTLKCPSSNPSSATTPFRKYWKAIIEPYTGLLEYPTDSSQLIFKTSDGHTFAKGYNRILYGGHGPYIEFSKTNVVLRSLIKKDRSLAKKRYYDLLYSNDESVKLYYQLKEVKGQKLAKPDSEMPVTDPTPVRDGYASYVIGMFHLSATRVLSGQIQVLTKKKLTSPPLSSRKETPSRKIPRKKITESTGMGHQPPTVILLRSGKKTTSINLSDWLTDSLLFRFLELVLLDAARLQSDTKTCPMLHYPVHHTLHKRE